VAINLSKGQKIDLTKSNPGLKEVIIGLGWDTNKYDGGADFDLDASVFMVGANGKTNNDVDFIFYNNLEHPSKSVIHTGDNRTGEGDGDAAVTIVGLIVGAAFAHNFGLAASPNGVPFNGKVAVIVGLVVVLGIAYSVLKGNTKRGVN